jgi:hypothetical protein
MKRYFFFVLILIMTGCTALEPAPVRPTGAPATLTPLPVLDQLDTADILPDPTEAAVSVPTLGAPQTEGGLNLTSPENPSEMVSIPGTAEIAIIRPGQFSRLTSPIRVIASLSNEEDTQTLITLHGEDGRVLAQRNFDVLSYLDPVNGNVILDMEFTIEGLVEAGWLEFKVFDQFGRLRALNTVNLILLSTGMDDRSYGLEDGERVEVQIPFPGQTEIDGGQLFLSGLVRLTPPPEDGMVEPLTVHLVDEQGSIVGEGRASVVLMPGSVVGQFVAEIFYSVDMPTPVLLTISLVEGRLRTMTYVKTFPLTLNP